MVKPIYALVGPDQFLQLQAQQEIAQQLGPQVQRVDVDGTAADLADVLDELRSYAMFGPAKLVVVRDADDFVSQFREQLENYVASPADSATLLLRLAKLPKNQRIYKLIAKSGQVIECEAPRDLAKWAIERAKSGHGVMLSPDAAKMLADMIGADLGRLDSELEKLALSAEGGKIGAELVAQSVSFQREREMWDLTNAVGSGDVAEAVRRWRQLTQMDSGTEYRAVTWLGIWLENVRKAQAMIRQGENAFAIGQALRIWPSALHQPFVQTAKKLGERGAAHALDLLAEIDYQSKTGVGDAAGNVETFLLTLALTKNA